MGKLKKSTLVILIGTFVISIVFLFTVIEIYEMTLNDAKNNHQTQQMEMAKAAANGINFFINNLREDMELLANYPSIRSFNKSNSIEELKFIFNHYHEGIVKTIFLADKNLNMTYSIGKEIPEEYLKNNIKLNNTFNGANRFWFSNVEPIKHDIDTQPLYFLIVLPYYSLVNNTDIIDGYIVYFLSFDLLMESFIKPLKLGEGDFAWVMDETGRLIFHPRHKEMKLKSIFSTISECSDCHKSFDIQRKMLNASSLSGEYKIGEEPIKIMSSIKIDLNNQKWILAISTFLPEVTEGLRGKFQLFFGLGIIILLVFISLGYLLFYVNSKRIRAEDTNKLLEERNIFQEQLNQAGKLASIGEIVDSVAHEINTPLGIISANSDAVLLSEKYSSDIELKDELRIIKDQTKRIGTYTRSLLSYSRRMPFQPDYEVISDIIDECIYLLSYRIRTKHIHLTKKYPEPRPVVFADKRQMEQVFINILNNSIDAIEKDGKIVIKIMENNFSELENNSGVSIEIIDNGSGINQEQLDNVFEPFFTTKSAQKGTGLGLSITRAIIQRHKGKITVNSKPGKYTSFIIFLPKKGDEENA